MADQAPTPTAPLAADMSPADIAAMYSSRFAGEKSRVRGERLPFLPRINLTVSLTAYKDKKKVTLGDWYLVPGDTPEGEEPAYENLGRSFECTVLTDSMQIVMRDDKNKILVESTEFQNYSGEPVILLDAQNGAPYVAAVAPYSGKTAVATISAMRNDPRFPRKMAKDGKTEVSSLSFDFNVYVMLPDGRLCILNNTKRGHFGTDPDTGDTCEFGNVSEDSYIRARATCHEQIQGLTLGHRIRVSSVAVGGGKDEPRPSFAVMGLQDPAKADLIDEKVEELKTYRARRWADRIGYAWTNTSEAQKQKLVTAYAGIRQLLDEVGGHEVAAAMVLGKHAAPALLAEPEPDYSAIERARKAGEQAAIDALAGEKDDMDAAPAGVIDVPVTDPQKFKGTGDQVKVEDLPF